MSRLDKVVIGAAILMLLCVNVLLAWRIFFDGSPQDPPCIRWETEFHPEYGMDHPLTWQTVCVERGPSPSDPAGR